MFKLPNILCSSVILAVVISGCSSLPEPLTVPVNPKAVYIDENHPIGHAIWCGAWEVLINKQDGNIDAVRKRLPTNALNIISFLEPPALSNLKIDFDSLFINPDEKLVAVDVILTHPMFTGEKRFNGFDVRGVVFGPDLLNADGYTRWFNPDEFDGLPFGYSDGLFGTPGSNADYTEHFNGYRYFADGIGTQQSVADFFSSPANVSLRGVFTEGTTVSRRYRLSWKGKESPIDFFVFNYAVYANYIFPEGNPPFGLDDYSLSANSAEAIFAKVIENSNTLFYDPSTGDAGGSIDFDIQIFDWQGTDGTYQVTVASVEPGLLDDTPADFMYVSDPYTGVFNIHADIQPDSADGLNLLISCADGTAYGENYLFNLMPVDHPLYNKPVVIIFPFIASVSDKKPGLNLVDWGDFLEPLPDTDAVDFCVIGDGSIHAGVYYFAESEPVPPDTQGGGVYRYPLDYSGKGYLYYNLHSPFPGYDDYDLWGNESDLASIDMVPFGAGIFHSSSTLESGLPPYLHRDWAYWFDMSPLLKNGLSSPKNDGILKWVDVSANYEPGGGGRMCALAITDELMEDAFPPVETEVGLMTVRYPYGFYDAIFNKAMFKKDVIGDVDGELDDDHATRLALDGDPDGLSHPTSNAVVYIIEDDITPDIEIFELNLMNENGSAQTHHIATIHGFDDPATTPIDIECYPALSSGFSDEWNWVAVLEDNSDNSWQVSLWAQDGSFICRSDTYIGKPLHLDIDATSGVIHIWGKFAGSLKWAKLEYN